MELPETPISPTPRRTVDPAPPDPARRRHGHGLPAMHRTRSPWAYRLCETLTEGVLYFMVVFSPWAFGTTQAWSTWVMNSAGFFMGLLLCAKGLIRWRTGYAPSRWDSGTSRDEAEKGLRHRFQERWVAAIMAVLTVLVLVYCLVSALNARATYYPDRLGFDYHDHYLAWLPHSYDSTSTWFIFWEYLGLACAFWATRDWLLGKTRSERHAERAGADSFPGSVLIHHDPNSVKIPGRLQRLLWVLCINAALLGLEGILQRLEGSGKLLWLVRPRINQTAEGQFGPYAYRSNAAQYYNLVWPVCLGFWWMLRQRAQRGWHRGARIGSGAQMILLPCVVITAASPIISTSRGGAVVAAGGLIVATVLLLLADRHGHWLARLGIFFLFLATLSLSAYLGWDQLEERLKRIFSDDWSGRAQIYENARHMAQEFPVWGSGPGTFASLYQLYRKVDQDWMAQVHDDWLETRITFGWVGFSMILLLLITVLLHWGLGAGIRVSGVFVSLVWIALAGCLIHAKYDFPFQIHSVLALFLMHCSLLSCLNRRA